MTPTLSIIIPTRERSAVLFYALRTLVVQDYADFEIIVSDNHSQDKTKQIVEEFSDPRMRYINTGARVSMSNNWEFALKHAKGTFTTFLGDDDGFIPGALTGAMNILESSKMNALVWEKIEYCWPDYIEKKMRNWISLKNRGYALQIAEGRKKLRQVINCKEAYNKLPCLYNGIVRTALLVQLREQSINGVLFNSMAPDVFSGVALSQIVGTYLCTDYPFSVNGASRHSIGTSFTREGAGDLQDSPKRRFIAENDHEYDPRLSLSPSILTIVMGEYMQAKRYLPALCLPEPSWRQYVKALIKSASQSSSPDEILRSAAHTARAVRLRSEVPEGAIRIPEGAKTNRGVVGDRFNFIAPFDMVSNIYDACQLLSGMLPEIADIPVSSPFSIFSKRMRVCLIGEMKALYRSLR